MEGLDVDDVFQHCRLNPTEVDAVTYYLPRLLSGETLHGVEKLIHSVEISGCEPKDLAARYAPVPQALSSGDRFFFTTCKSKNGSKLQSVRSAGGGTWTIQKTTEISHAGGKVGEAIVAEGVKVFCRMHLAQHAPAAAAKNRPRTCFKNGSQRPRLRARTHGRGQRPAAAADPHPPRPKKRMRVATPSFTATAPVFLPDDSIPEANDDMGGFSCSMEELLGWKSTKLSGCELQRTSLRSKLTRTSNTLTTSEPDEELQFLLDEAAAEHEPQAVPEAEWQSDEALGKDGEAHGFDIEETDENDGSRPN
ncbi:Protein CUP-SHAPED COTYLEDON 3 [Hordeum vulgare]|nr:Protein CUP-SHAPED COTYLEDON 3 [Hordeum vulgare]